MNHSPSRNLYTTPRPLDLFFFSFLANRQDFVPEWPLQALPHVPADLLKEVVRALLLLNQTSEAATSGKYSAWDAPLSYSYLRCAVPSGMIDSFALVLCDSLHVLSRPCALYD